MLLSHSSSLFYPSIKHAGVGKYYSKKNVPFSTSNNIHLYNTNIGFSSKYDIVMPKKRYSCFTSGCHLHLLGSPATAADTKDGHAGIGILEFFEGKNILVTGATGLLGKVVVEKILRSTSVGKVYLLIKAKDKEAAFDRLNREIIRPEVMTCLKEKYGKSYEGFVREKLIAIVGDICEPNMGMDHDSIEAIRKDVHVIIQSAACTTFNERYDVMVDANVIAPQRVVRFAKTCHKLQLFTHVSTAYVSGRREGLILEEALKMGESGRKEGDDEVGVDVGDEISLLLKSSPIMLSHYDATKYFRKLGQQRAEMLGWDTTYQLSKSMGEMVVNEIRGDIPLLIIRPAIIESCYRQPLPGWIQGNRMFDPVAICYGKGQLPAYFGDPQVPVEFIPVDLVANTMIAAIAKHGNRNNNIDEVNVYHVASAASNPITSSQVFEYLYECFREEPLSEQANIARLQFFDNFEEFSRYTTQEIILRHTTGDTRMIPQCNAKVEYAQQLCKLYQFVAFFKARFHTGNTDKLLEEMSKEEKLHFEVDVRNINWKKYFQEIYVPGLRKHICN